MPGPSSSIAKRAAPLAPPHVTRPRVLAYPVPIEMRLPGTSIGWVRSIEAAASFRPASRAARVRSAAHGHPDRLSSFDRRELKVRVQGPPAFNGPHLAIKAAISGAGLAFMPEDHVRDHVAGGRLVRALADWRPPIAGYRLYYPSRAASSHRLSHCWSTPCAIHGSAQNGSSDIDAGQAPPARLRCGQSRRPPPPTCLAFPLSNAPIRQGVRAFDECAQAPGRYETPWLARAGSVLNRSACCAA